MDKQKRTLFIAALHGDEGFSVGVLEKIEKILPRDKYAYDWVIGNEEAYKHRKRFMQLDMNRIAPGNIESDIYEERRVAELIAIGNTYDRVIDIHGSDADCGIFAITSNPTLDNLILARSLPLQNVVLWPSSSESEGPVTHFLNCPAIGIECGLKHSKEAARNLERLIVSILLQTTTSIQHRQVTQSIFEVYGSVENVDTTNMKEFEETSVNNEVFYPLLIDSYKPNSVRTMRKLHI